jgi:hypothetical protein
MVHDPPGSNPDGGPSKEQPMAHGIPDTGIDDPDYDLVLVLQQALEDCWRYQWFAKDARARGDDEVADFFDELGESDRDIAQRAKKLLLARLDPERTGSNG